MLWFSRDNSSTYLSLQLRLRSLRRESVFYLTRLVGSQSVNPFVRCLQLIHWDSLMSGIFFKIIYIFLKLWSRSHFKWGGSYTLSPAGRTAYVLSLPKHVQMGQNLMKIFRCRQQRKKSPQFGFIESVIADTTRNLFHQLVPVAVTIWDCNTVVRLYWNSVVWSGLISAPVRSRENGTSICWIC